jgi:hypothetical protein
MRQALMVNGQPESTGIQPSGLLADDGTNNEIKQYLINSDRDVAAGQSIDDPATDNGGNSAKHQNPQLSADIHMCSPVADAIVSIEGFV